MEQTYRFDPVGRCIYCGSDSDKAGLSDEHIVPYALGGNLILPKSTCKQCAAITAEFEQIVTRGMYGVLRIRLNFPTRRPKERPTHLPTWITEGGVQRLVSLPVGAGIVTVPFAVFKAPGYLRNPPVQDTSNEKFNLSLRAFGRDPVYANPVYNKVGSPTVRISAKSLARMLAKIAHSFCVALYGIDSFEHWLAPIILGHDRHDENFGYLVGGLSPNLITTLDPHPKDDGFQLCSTPYNIRGKEIVVTYIQYFALAGNPANCVVVGGTTKEFPRERFQNDN